jgi:branched-chain amino acid aminotransferase
MADRSFDKLDGHIWYDGEFVPWQEANVHLLTHALHYGSGVFEGVRAYNGRIFRLQEHTERLFLSAKILDLDIPFSPEELNVAQEEVLKKNGLSDAYLRPIAWRGAEQMGLSARKASVHVAIAAWEWPSYFSPEERMKGLKLDISRWRRPAPDTAPVSAKATGLYMINTLSKHEAENKGFADALMLDWRGQVAEATGANAFFIKKGVIHTPIPDNCLDGITRRVVIELARQRGWEVVERAIWPTELAGFEECFLTGTAAEVTPVASIGPYDYTVGEITRALMEDYDALVRGKN